MPVWIFLPSRLHLPIASTSPEGERADQRVLTWPLSTGVNLGWQYTAYQKAQFQYQFRFDAYVRDRTTSEDFVLPPSTITNGLGGAWEYRRGGYSLVANGTWYRRHSGPQPAYRKYSASLSRDWYFKAVHKIHLNGAWFGGQPPRPVLEVSIRHV